MRLKFSWSRLAVLGAVCLLPVKAGGCGGDTACFTFAQAAYEKAGACPVGPSAMKHFSESSCGETGPISSVNGVGSFDGEFCCYPVTQSRDFFDCGSGAGGFIGGTGGSFEDGAGGGFIGTGGATTSTGGFDAGGDTTSTSTGGFTTSSTGGGGSPQMCASCNDELTGVSTDPGQLCDQAAPLWASFQECKCGGTGACTTLCSDNLCMSIMPSSDCLDCLNSTSGCSAQLAACEIN